MYIIIYNLLSLDAYTDVWSNFRFHLNVLFWIIPVFSTRKTFTLKLKHNWKYFKILEWWNKFFFIEKRIPGAEVMTRWLSVFADHIEDLRFIVTTYMGPHHCFQFQFQVKWCSLLTLWPLHTHGAFNIHAGKIPHTYYFNKIKIFLKYPFIFT